MDARVGPTGTAKGSQLCEVVPHLFLGGKQEARDLSLLLAKGVRSVLNMTPERRDDPIGGVDNFHQRRDGADLVYLRIPVFDNKGQHILDKLTPAADFIRRRLHHGGVLVHCQQGRSRSVAAVAAFLVRDQNMSLSDALALIRSKRPLANPNETFLEDLAAFERQVQRPPQLPPAGRTATLPPAEMTLGPRRPTESALGPLRPDELRLSSLGPAEMTLGPRRPTESALGPLRPPEVTMSSSGSDLLLPLRPDEVTLSSVGPSGSDLLLPLRPDEVTLSLQQPSETEARAPVRVDKRGRSDSVEIVEGAAQRMCTS